MPPIFIINVTIEIISLGDIICANCELVSIRISLGSIPITLAQGSLSKLVHTLNIRSIKVSSISENSRFFSSGYPPPPASYQL